MRFREHGLDKPTIHVEGRQGIIDYLGSGLCDWSRWPDLDQLDLTNLQSEDLGLAIIGNANKHAWWKGWPAFHLITLKGYGVVGYTDAPLA
jgi:hypothetical protein